jgi:hypothetical protein
MDAACACLVLEPDKDIPVTRNGIGLGIPSTTEGRYQNLMVFWAGGQILKGILELWWFHFGKFMV